MSVRRHDREGLCLALIRGGRPVTVGDMARHLGVARPTAQRIGERLTADGHATRNHKGSLVEAVWGAA